MKNTRIYFIDIVRAFAILMMLQGHFINSFLDNAYRDLNSTAFSIWSYFRGITAPTFFTVSGLIFTYLLLKSKKKRTEKLRMKKGILRGFMLIGVGYLIRIPFIEWLSGRFNSDFLVIDVLQCIGVSLILTVSFYYLFRKKIVLFSLTMFLFGIVLFLTEPLYRTLEINSIPIFLSNYISKSNGSVFTMLPWFGYSAFGAFIATLFYWNFNKSNFKTIAIISFLITGMVLAFFSSQIILFIHEITGIQLFFDSANYNYLFSRLGDVLLYFAFFYTFEHYLKHPTILKIGQKTLSIYVIHFTILYGSFFGIGLYNNITKTLSPIEVLSSAILFLVSVCFLSFHYNKVLDFFKALCSKLVSNEK